MRRKGDFPEKHNKQKIVPLFSNENHWTIISDGETILEASIPKNLKGLLEHMDTEKFRNNPEITWVNPKVRDYWISEADKKGCVSFVAQFYDAQGNVVDCDMNVLKHGNLYTWNGQVKKAVFGEQPLREVANKT